MRAALCWSRGVSAEANPVTEGERRIVKLHRPNVLFCSKCYPREYATHRQVMKTVRGVRTIQYLCPDHAKALGAKWRIKVEE